MNCGPNVTGHPWPTFDDDDVNYDPTSLTRQRGLCVAHFRAVKALDTNHIRVGIDRGCMPAREFSELDLSLDSQCRQGPAIETSRCREVVEIANC